MFIVLLGITLSLLLTRILPRNPQCAQKQTMQTGSGKELAGSGKRPHQGFRYLSNRGTFSICAYGALHAKFATSYLSGMKAAQPKGRKP
jgi:hypothetical protein